MMTRLLNFSIMIPNPIWNPEIIKLTKANALILSFYDSLIQLFLTRNEANKNLKIFLRILQIRIFNSL